MEFWSGWRNCHMTPTSFCESDLDCAPLPRITQDSTLIFSDTTGVVQLHSPVLPSSERRLLAALGNIRTDRSAATMHVTVPEYTTSQIEATLNALGLLQSGQAA